jgi:hypothetical protein
VRLLPCISCAGRIAFEIVSPSSVLGSSTPSLTNIDRNGFHSHRTICESTKASRGHFSYHYRVMLLRSYVSSNINKKHTSHHQSTLHAPEAPCELLLFSKASSFRYTSSCDAGSMRCAFPCDILTSDYPWAILIPHHLHIITVFALCIIRYTASS